ncbi:NAD(P)-binding [Fusarium albosuccineum]|uniref:NAD(P)-binding n=1 Tax=Fusarium albosuccineum TaxID=1237068 RepID=A0A8H4P6S4_9HYPO|nr:NAD(P)-binding [Fusarium albosuccineum]
MSSQAILVVGATGNQGYAVATQLLQRGHTVHALMRNVSSDKAKHLSSLGAVLCAGDLASKPSILATMDNVQGVFAALPTSPMHEEVDYLRNIIEAAQEPQVEHFIFSSVARTGDHETFPGWSDNYPMAWYWKDKHEAESLVRTARFKYWTILRPAFFIQNFCRPLCDFLLPALTREHKLQLAYRPDTRLHLVHTGDIGVFAANAFDSPLDYTGRSIPLASESLRGTEMAALLSRITGVEINVEFLDDEQAAALKEQGVGVIMDSQIWQREIGYNVDIEALQEYGVSLRHLADLHREELGW